MTEKSSMQPASTARLQYKMSHIAKYKPAKTLQGTEKVQLDINKYIMDVSRQPQVFAMIELATNLHMNMGFQKGEQELLVESQPPGSAAYPCSRCPISLYKHWTDNITLVIEKIRQTVLQSDK